MCALNTRGYPNALKPPFVLIGDTLSAGTFWSGNLLSAWAEKWVDYWTKGKAVVFTTSAEEDAGILQALTFLEQAGKADLKLVWCCAPLATTTVAPQGQTAAAFLRGEATTSGLSGFIESLNAAYRVGSPVVNEITEHWSRYEDQVSLDPYKYFLHLQLEIAITAITLRPDASEDLAKAGNARVRRGMIQSSPGVIYCIGRTAPAGGLV